MRCLTVEDDVTSRLLLQRILSVYGCCDVTVNDLEALVAFDLAHMEGMPYDMT
ncbi:two-component system, chemotaxis family, response regulator CheY [Trichlorobacter thiogenes]|uniref:Two-component system, chemotaxis family, response regulator CheY n=1 Tax=Trichlorobacter thiogenes TaxID=115783 RepID=A0A1T4N0W7_9BACT|nr:hypothetical protein [Trichlorobacter thiogenes]SJZ72677.1 two-component system, chemotaxis family, response regulator CheY [Trichlorobacter thiogenes]